MNTAVYLHKIAATPGNKVSHPENIRPFVGTNLAWDNIDRLEEILSGGAPPTEPTVSQCKLCVFILTFHPRQYLQWSNRKREA